MTTINAQNALQIREKPMEVYISLQTGSSAKISTYTPQGSYKSFDNTLGDSAISMREIADLAGDGFPLDGSHVLFDATETPSSSNGKLGLRGTAGQNLAVTISAAATMTAVTVSTRGTATIAVDGTTYPATGLNVIPINAASATLILSPTNPNGRAEIDYIVPGIILTATNDTLTRCTLALRGNLDVIDHSWEESEIEFQMYYPYDISSSFAYVQNEWPITYQAGYDGDLSPERKFYLSDAIAMENNIITIRGVDASHLLSERTINESTFTTRRNSVYKDIYDYFVGNIRWSGITIVREQKWSQPLSGAVQSVIFPEMTARDLVAGIMNLTMNHTRGSNQYGMQFVDAGIPTVEHGDGTVYGNIWAIRKSDCGEWQETRERAIAKIKNSNEERKFNETFTVSNKERILFTETPDPYYIPASEAKNITPMKRGEVLDLSYDSFYFLASGNVNLDSITATPSRGFFKALNDSVLRYDRNLGAYVLDHEKIVSGYPVAITGGVSSFSNPDGLPGQIIEMEPFIYGIITDSNGETVLNYPSLFKRSTHTIKFTWKGDPRMQPLDYIRLIDDTGPAARSTWFRITNIDLAHEGGGTQAEIEAREWMRPQSVPDYYVLIDSESDKIITNNNDKIEVLTEGE